MHDKGERGVLFNSEYSSYHFSCNPYIYLLYLAEQTWTVIDCPIVLRKQASSKQSPNNAILEKARELSLEPLYFHISVLME
jgi:hypothetical protein